MERLVGKLVLHGGKRIKIWDGEVELDEKELEGWWIEI